MQLSKDFCDNLSIRESEKVDFILYTYIKYSFLDINTIYMIIL